MKDCQGQLLQRARRGLATAQEQTALESHLSSCESCRMSADLMGDFDSVGEAEPGDYERVAAMATYAAGVRGRRAPVPLRGSRFPWRLVLAALVVTGAATAGVVRFAQEQSSTIEAPLPKPPGPVPHPQSAPLPASLSSSGPTEAPMPEPSEKPISGARGAKGATSPSRAPSSAVSTTAVSAQALYRAANDARRAGRSSEAVVSYQKLQRDFPGAPEAHAARVSLGGLLLRSGSASAALTQFDAYLAMGGGQLSAEALFGRAQALRVLGRSAEEAQNLRRLVSTYPRSAYATHAKRRLLELR